MSSIRTRSLFTGMIVGLGLLAGATGCVAEPAPPIDSQAPAATTQDQRFQVWQECSWDDGFGCFSCDSYHCNLDGECWTNYGPCLN